MTAPTVPTPHDPSRQSDRRSKSSPSARNPASIPPGVSKLPARGSESFAMRLFGPPEPRRITRQTLTGNAPGSSRLRWGSNRVAVGATGCSGSNRVSTPAQTLYDGGGANLGRQRLGIRHDRQNQPYHRARGRRGNAHALVLAKGPASGGEPAV